MIFTTQRELFEYVWNTRPHKCELTGKIIREPKARCFPHILGKWMNKKYKFDSNNIMLVYWIDEHREIDRLASWNKYELEQYLIKWIRITIEILKNR